MGGDDFRFGLSPRLLFHNHEFTAFIIGAGLAQKTRHLKREGYGAVHVLVEAIKIAVFVMQQQRCCPRLAVFRANLEETGMAFGETSAKLRA